MFPDQIQAPRLGREKESGRYQDAPANSVRMNLLLESGGGLRQLVSLLFYGCQTSQAG
jgi:hypothetical protein